jgi:hypothetical protein
VETTQQIRNAATQYMPPESPAEPASQARDSTKPLALSNVARMPANIQARIISITTGWLIPRIAVSAYAVLSRDSSNPSISAASSTGQKPRSSGAPDSASQTTPTRNRAKGASAPAAPPWNSSCSSVPRIAEA